MYFIQLHLFFDETADSLVDQIDMIAERVRSLGSMALGTARPTAGHSHLPEDPTEIVEGKQVVQELAQHFAYYAATNRAAIATASELGDQDTAALFTEVSLAVDKHLWFLEAHLQE